MRLRELKCKNCGAKVSVDENAVKVECEYCHTTFAVDDAYNDGYKFEKGRIKAQSEHIEKSFEQAKEIIEPVGKAFAVHSIIAGVIGFVIFVVALIIIGTVVFKQINSADEYDEFDINRFNNSFEMYTGTEHGLSVGRLIDEVSTNNKKETEHKITVIYNDITTQDPEEMKKIKKQLDDWTEYEVSFEYDDVGFIYQVTIEQ